MRTLSRSLRVASACTVVALWLAPAPVQAQTATDVLSYHGNTPTSIGVNSAEQQITPASIGASTFGKQFATDITDIPNTTGIPASTLPSGINYTAAAGQVYAEPLVKTGVNITTGASKGVHDVVFVATSMDSLFAIDATGGTILWKDSFLYNASGNSNLLNPTIAAGITACPGGYGTELNSQDISPWIGIVGTPVIDGTNGYIYLVAKTREVHSADQTHPHYVLTLHKVRLADGLDTSAVMADTTLQTSDTTFTFNSGPYVVGSGLGAITVSGQSRIYLNAVRHMARPALELYNGRVYVALGSHGDNQPYHGWVLTYDASTLACNGCWNPTPSATEGEGGIWQGGAGVVIDASGYIYFEIGNGAFDGTISGTTVSGLDGKGFPAKGDYSDCFMKLALDPTTTQGSQGTNLNGWGLKVVDYFAPYNNHTLDSGDKDVGSGGPTLLPDAAGSTAHPHLMIGAGKEGKFYLIDRDNMGEFSTTDNIVQTFAMANSGSFCASAYFNGRFYTTAGYGGVTASWPLANAAITTGSGQSSADTIAFPGCSPYISANGSNNGVVWIVDKGTGQLRAYDASNLATELWTSNLNATRDALGSAVKFSVPTPVNGHVYVGTADHLVVYGPPVPPTAPPAAPTALSASATGPSTVALSWTDNSNNENGFRVERSSDNVNFTEVATVGVNQTTYGDSGLSAQATYYYRVRAANLYNTVSYSAYTNVASATTPGTGSQLPVYLYHFDEGAGTAAADSVSGNNGVLAGVPPPAWIAPGRIGNSDLSFNGSGTYAQVGSSAAFSFGFDTTGGTGSGWSFAGSSGYNASNGSPDGVSFYSQSQTAAVVATGTATSGSTPVGIGTYDFQFKAAQITGTPADIRITVTDSAGKAVFSTATRDYALSTPAGTWAQFDFPFSVTDAPANDYLVVKFSSDSNNGSTFGWDTITGTFTPTFVSSVRVATDLSPTLGTTSSLLCWINTTQVGNDTHYKAPAITGVEQAAASNDINWGYLDSKGHICMAVGDSTLASTTVINDGKWHHVGFSRDASAGTVKIYIDGVLNTSGTLTTGSKTSSFQLIGALSDVLSDGTTFAGGNYFNGQLDDVRIYNLVVDPAVVSSLALPPAAPTKLVVTPASGTELDLGWTDNATNETGYEVWRSISGGAWVRVAQLAANTVSYMDVGLTQGTSYSYYVRAVDSAGSADSNTVNSSTPMPPQTPSGAMVTSLTPYEVDLQWVDNSSNESGFKILRRVNNVNFAEIGSLPPNTTTYQDKSVQPGIAYEYHIQAYNIAGYSDFAGLGVTTPTQYQAYLASYFTSQQLSDPTITGDGADPDHDGISNLLEYAFGTDPTHADVSNLPTVSMQNGYMTISFIQRVAPTDVTYTVEVSGDMNTWNSGSGYTTQVSTAAIDSATQRVVVRDNTLVSAAARRFIRVRVSH